MTEPSDLLALRPYRLDDADRLTVLVNDPDVTATTSSIPFPFARSDAEAFLSQVRNETGRKVSRAITMDGELVGAIGLGPRADDNEEIGYWIGKAYWGKGIASWAVCAFVALLDELEVSGPIHAQTMQGNEASRRVLEKNGFVYVGDGACTTPARDRDSAPSHRFVLER
ncbi:MAG: GNAT family N-acetyltransferase [Pseudomonadota bacterium]